MSNVKYFKIDDSGEDFSVSGGGGENIRVSKSKSFDNSKIKCFTCYKLGDFLSDCPERRGSDDFFKIIVASDEYNFETISLVVSILDTTKGSVID